MVEVRDGTKGLVQQPVRQGRPLSRIDRGPLEDDHGGAQPLIFFFFSRKSQATRAGNRQAVRTAPPSAAKVIFRRADLSVGN